MKRIRLFCLYILIINIVLLAACSKGPVKTVQEEINAIGIVKESSLAVIETARADYERLTEKEKEKVRNYQTLLDAEYDYNKILASKVDNFIDSIVVKEDNVPQKVKEAKEKYELLTEEQKQLVNKIDKLDELIEEYNTYQIERVIELIKYVNEQDGNVKEADFLEIDNRYAQLSDEQKETLVESLGMSYEEAMQVVQAKRCDYYIKQIDYIEGVPSKQELEKMLQATEIYAGMSDSAKQALKNTKAYNNAIKEYVKYKNNRAKTDKLFARRQYISQCDEIAISEILSYTSSYKGHLIALSIKVGDESGGFSHSYAAEVEETGEAVEIKDKRGVREPEINTGDSLTVYGEITGTKVIKKKQENSGLFNSNFLAKNAEEYTVPVIEFIYTDNDNLGIIKSGDPNDKDVNTDEEFETLINTMDMYIKE